MQILTAFALLIPAFSLLYTPQPLALLFLRVYNATPTQYIAVLPKLRCQV